MDKNGIIILREHFVTATKDTDNTGVLRKVPSSLIESCVKKITVDSCGFIHYE